MVNHFLLFSLTLQSKQNITHFNAVVTFFGCHLSRTMIYALEGGEASLGKWKGEGLEIGSGWLELRHGHGLSQDTEKIKSQVKKKRKPRGPLK